METIYIILYTKKDFKNTKIFIFNEQRIKLYYAAFIKVLIKISIVKNLFHYILVS
jgi:hypothetical protein